MNSTVELNGCQEDFLEVIAQQNKYNNEHGQIPRDVFINQWHSLTNEKLENIILTSLDFLGKNNIKNKELIESVQRVSEYLLNNRQFHHNVCNPSIRDEKNLMRQYGKKFKINQWSGNTIKRDFFQTMRRVAEMYNAEMNIPIQNKDSDINKFPSGWDGLDPVWEEPTQFQQLFDR